MIGFDVPEDIDDKIRTGRMDTEEAIMLSTYNVLTEYGYPGTTISRIADDIGKSKSSLYYYYEDKTNLLTDFLEFLLDDFEGRLEEQDGETAIKEIQSVIEYLLPTDDDDFEFRQTLLEIRIQAPHQPKFREQFERSDALILEKMSNIIARGTETGEFQSCNPNMIAGFIFTSLYGIIFRSLTHSDRGIIERNRRVLMMFLDGTLASE